jgi:Flp pilus assembly protein TadD
VQQEFSSDPEVFTSMGTALLIGKQPSEAEFAFERALSLRPNSAVAETNVAAAHQQAGDIDGTISTWSAPLPSILCTCRQPAL